MDWNQHWKQKEERSLRLYHKLLREPDKISLYRRFQGIKGKAKIIRRAQV